MPGAPAPTKITGIGDVREWNRAQRRDEEALWGIRACAARALRRRMGTTLEEGIVRRLGISVVAAAVAAAALMAGSAFSSATAAKVKLTGTYAGTATVKVADDVADIAATGPGKATGLGVGKITGVGKGDASAQPCVPFTGTGQITGLKGMKITFTMLSGAQGCGDEQGNVFSINARAKITGGAGKVKVGKKLYPLKKAKGTFKITGIYDRGAGTFSIKLNGLATV